VLIGIVDVQSWVYSQPNETSTRTGFVVQNQRVEVEDDITNEAGQNWYRIRWSEGDSQNSGWIEAERIEIFGTR
jgi:hypothetical protein